MSKQQYILSIDQGTTSSRAILFDRHMHICAQAQQEFQQYYPQPGWVEHDAEEIYSSVIQTCKQVLKSSAIDISAVVGIGITNQRETVVAWDKHTAKPLYRAIVWQDRRTADYCEQLNQQNLGQELQNKTGLLLDPYFSASKIKWLLDNVPEVAAALRKQSLCVGTIDSYLIARLSAQRVHVTDITNASRTQLFNIHTLDWDAHLLDVFSIPREILPEVKACDAYFADCDKAIFGRQTAICGVAGDQQAALIGQACFQPGQIKSTYGTGCFALMNTGSQALISKNRLLTTVAYQLDGEVHYALEGSIFIAGAAIQWLRDGLKIIDSAEQSQQLALEAQSGQGLFIVPAFTGMGAPYWNPDARGAIYGLTRATGIEDICRAALASVAYQSADLFSAMEQDVKTYNSTTAQLISEVRVDGGMARNSWLMQFLADMLNIEVQRPACIETTARGAAYLAGKHQGLYPQSDVYAAHWLSEDTFKPNKDERWRQQRKAGWHSAIESTLNFKVSY